MDSFIHATTLSVFIERQADKVYEFAFDLENSLIWVSICQSIRKEKEKWLMETPYGSLNVKITERNGLGIIDHYVSPFPEVEMYDAMRIFPNGTHCEIFMTVFQFVGMSDEEYKQFIEISDTDLQNLKHIMESKP